MTTTLDLPDDLAQEVQRRAARDGRGLAEEVVDLVRKGLASSDALSAHVSSAMVVTDPTTGLPVVQSAPDAPISRMTSDEILAILRQSSDEEELERFSRSVRR